MTTNINMGLSCLCIATVVVAGCVSGAPPAVTTLADAEPVAAPTGRLVFHSDPWVNLHHFLYEWARGDLGIPSARPTGGERLSLPQWSPEERSEWLRAVEFYKRSIVIPEPSVSRIGSHLSEVLRADGAMIGVLQDAMPVYRRWWGDDHHRRNNEWIEFVQPILERHENSIVSLTEELFDAEWPEAEWRIDVSVYAPFLGYASPAGQVLAHSTAPENQGLYGLEVVLHELLHTRNLATRLSDELERAVELIGEMPPPQLGHALVYATAGEFTRTIASREGLPEHVPFWVHQDFERWPDWSRFGPAIREHWFPVLRKQVTLREGVMAYAQAIID